MGYKAVLFDLDNTLIDFMKMKRLCTEEAVSGMIAAGLPMDQSEAVEILFEMYKEHGIEDQNIFQKFLEKTQGKIDYKVLAEGINSYRRVKASFTEPYPKVISTLLRLRERGIKLGIVSDAPRLQAWLRLASMQLSEFFDFVITMDDVKGKLKPHELPFKAALEKLGIPPGEILFVGDNPNRDIKGANKVGMVSVLAKYGELPEWESEENARFEIFDVSEILGLVDR